MAEASVRVSGIVFASMMFQHVNSDSDAEGLLLGQVTLREHVTISDSPTDHIHVEETFNVQKLVSCLRPQQFYSGVGQVDADSLRELLPDPEPALLGWYRQRRGSDQRLTLRERRVHQSLGRLASNPNLLFMLLTPGQPEASTHRVEYAAFVSRCSQLVPVPVTIHNLGVLDQPPYWTSAPTCSAAGYSRTLSKHWSRFFSAPEHLRDVSEMSRMNESLQSELQDVCGAVAQSERRVGALQAEVSELRRQVRAKRKLPAKEAGPADDGRNRRLQAAVRALLLSSPLYCSQTLSLDGLPLPEQTCGTGPPDPDPGDSLVSGAHRRGRRRT